MTEDRRDWVDAARGVAIVLVVIGHVVVGLYQRGIVSEALFAAVYQRIYAFHMPVFFAISGMFVTATLARATVPAFLRSRLKRLFWPMVLWTYLFIAMKVAAGSLANSPAAPEDLLVLPVPGYLHLWFLWALLLIQLSLLAARPLLVGGRFPPAALALLMAVGLVTALMPMTPMMAHWIGVALRAAPYFALGIVLGHLTPLERMPRGARLALAAVFVLVVAAWPVLSGIRPLQLGLSMLLTLAFLAVLAGLGNAAPGRLAAGAVALGRASMVIYLAHTIFAAALREALAAVGITDVALHVALGTGIGLVGPLALLWLARQTRTAGLLGI